MNYDHLTPEQKQRCKELHDDRDQCSYEQECAYDIVRAAMALFETPDLRTLKNAMHLASVFVNDELEEMEAEAQELGLAVWMAKQKETDEQEEQERLDREEWEREEQEELDRLEASFSNGSESA